MAFPSADRNLGWSLEFANSSVARRKGGKGWE